MMDVTDLNDDAVERMMQEDAELIEQQAKRIEQLEAALWNIHDECDYCKPVVRKALLTEDRE